MDGFSFMTVIDAYFSSHLSETPSASNYHPWENAPRTPLQNPLLNLQILTLLFVNKAMYVPFGLISKTEVLWGSSSILIILFDFLYPSFYFPYFYFSEIVLHLVLVLKQYMYILDSVFRDSFWDGWLNEIFSYEHISCNVWRMFFCTYLRKFGVIGDRHCSRSSM